MRSGTAASVAALAGAAVMSLELTAVRLLAPHFGDNAFVWTNAIGVILLALALGAFWGGRLADRRAGVRRLQVLLAVAAGLCVLVPFVSRPLGGWLLPQELPLDAAMPALVRASLVATCLLFGPPVFLLGAVTPMLVTALATADGRVGHAAGTVGAASTVGSLVGTFATTHLLVPGLGSRGTVWLDSGILLLCVGLLGPRRLLAVAWLPPLLALGEWGALRPPPAGFELLAERESRYQYLQVVREDERESRYQYLQVVRGDVGGRRTTLLKINEGLDSFHSVALEGTAFTAGRYYDYFALVPFLVGDGVRPEPLRVLSLGSAAGTFHRLFQAVFPGCSVDGVEIDPATVELGEEWFGGRPGKGEVFAGVDARVFVEHVDRRYEVVLVDAYEHQVSIPAHVASEEFFSAVRRRLVPGGAVAINVGGLTAQDPVPELLGRTMAGVFGSCRAFKVPLSRNLMLVARRGGNVDPEVLSRVPVQDGALGRILDRGRMASLWTRFTPGPEPVLVDDRPVIDRLLLSEMEPPAQDTTLVEMAGALEPGEVVARTEPLLRADNGHAALEQLRAARRPTGRLRRMAGDARWLARDLTGAAAEYRAALAMDLPPAERQRVASSLRIVEEELEGPALARQVAARNGWLALGLAAAAAVAAVMLLRAG